MKRRIFVMLSILFIGIGMAWSQVRSVKGVVTSSEDGLPVVGASVLVSGTTMGSITDVDGKFSISKVPSSAETLTISYVGMRTKVVAITSEVMQIILDSDSKILDEVVVTAQGLTRQEKSLGYSIQKVDAEDLTIARQTDLNNALAGKVSGVRFLGSSGATFDGGRIVLRGTSSLTESSGVEPIYVIDGVMSEDANSVNMDDVESINVLKGPAATALYGSRGGNGAVIITTKGGSASSTPHTEINVSHTFSWEKMYDHYEMQNQYGGGYLGADAELPVFHYDANKHPSYLQALDGKAYYDYNNDASWGPAFNGQQYLPAYAWDPEDPRFGQTTSWSPQMKLSDLFETGFTNTTNVAFSRSGRNFSTRVSFSNVSRQGITPNSDAARRYLSARVQFRPIERLKISVDYKYTYRKNHNAAVEGYQELGNALYSYQQWGHTNVNLKDYKNYMRADGSHIYWNLTSRDSDPTSLGAAFHDNPYAIFNEINTTDTYQWSLFSGDAELTIWKNLKAGIRVNGNIRSEKMEQVVPNGMFGQTSSYQQDQNSFSDIQTQGRITWDDRFVNDRLSVNAALFFEDRQTNLDELSGFTRNGLIMNGFNSLGGSMGDAGGSNYKEKIHEQSIYGTASAGWDDTYYIDLSLRNDWSSVLHPDNNSYLYGGLSVAAIASNWFKNADWLDFWKLRASVAQVGSTMSPYNVYNIYSIRNSDDEVVKYNGLSTMWTNPNLRDPYIKPTISTSYEIGTEFRMFNNRFWGDINFYNRDSKNQIVNMNTTPASGYTTRKMNAGLIRNRGIEVSLGGEIIRTKNWSWEVNANVAHNNNTLEELVDDQTSYQLYWRSWSTRVYSYAEVGKPIGVIRGSVWKRNPEGQLMFGQTSSGTYVPLYESSAQEELGNIQPDLTGGFSTTLRYKGFTFGASLDFQVGGVMASATNMFGEASGLLASTTGLNDKGNPIRNSVENGGGVRLDGVVENADGSYSPVTTYMDAQTYYQSYKSLLWEDYVYDASYVKLRELSIGYTVPQSFLKRLNWGVKQASISFVAQNPWLIYSAVPNVDPSEMGAATEGYIEGGQAASVRSYGFTVNLTF